MKPKVNPNAGQTPEVFDSPLRYWVYSRTAQRKYLVEIDAYDFNGTCQCKDFAVRLEPLLRRGVTPAQAVATGLVVLKERQRPEDALRCYHIVDGFMQFATDAAKIVVKHTNQQKNAPAKDSPPPRRPDQADRPSSDDQDDSPI